MLLEHVESTDQAEMERLDTEITAGKARITDLMSEYEKTISQPKDRELFEAIKAARAPYIECYERVSTLARSNSDREAMALLNSRLKPLYKNFFDASRQWSSSTRTLPTIVSRILRVQ